MVPLPVREHLANPRGKKVPAGPIGAPRAARSGQPCQRERPDGESFALPRVRRDKRCRTPK
jgi:hypothetical protein